MQPTETGHPHHLLLISFHLISRFRTRRKPGETREHRREGSALECPHHHVVMDAAAIETLHRENFMVVEDFPFVFHPSILKPNLYL